jgi:hypothetical protein
MAACYNNVMEREPRGGEITQKDIDKLLSDLAGYLPLYDSLNPELQSEWDKVEAEAIGAETDLTLKKKEVMANLKRFLETLEARLKKEAN